MADDALTDVWVVRSGVGSPARVRLFCFPYAGGGPTAFRTWAGALPSGVEVCAVQLPGRERRMAELPYTEFDEALRATAYALEAYTDLPYIVFGHSLGALLGFEWARHMRDSGKRCAMHLFLSGQDAPPVSNPLLRLHQLPEPEFIHELKRMGGIPELVLAEPDLMRLLLPRVRADLAVYETYVYEEGEALDCPITVFGALDDHRTSRDGLIAWRRRTTQTSTLRMFPGTHFFLQTAQMEILQDIAHNLEL
jgi:medium-chain acyl-[acyl-carrier-protein] hydrolase